MSVTVYHNPACTTSRNVIQFIRDSGIEPTIVEYLKTPPDRATLTSLLERMGLTHGNSYVAEADPTIALAWTIRR